MKTDDFLNDVVSSHTEERIKCTVCHGYNTKEAIFCQYCGVVLKKLHKVRNTENDLQK